MRAGRVHASASPAAVLSFLLAGSLNASEVASAPGPQAELLQRVASIRHAVEDLREMLGDYYDGTGILQDNWTLDAGDPGRSAGIQALSDRFARAIVQKRTFVIGTIGSSVVAGYGNCRRDCYQQQLERLLGPVLEAGGAGLEVRNTGQGGFCGDSYRNQVWCIPMLVGDDVDVTHYSWTYFEAGRKDVAAHHEMFYRWSLLMPRAPVPEIIVPGDCARMADFDVQLLGAYGRFGADILCMTRGLARRGWKPGEWGDIGDGMHTTTREGEQPGVPESRRQSLGVQFRNWHPGPLLFQTVADSLALRYTEAILVALVAIENEADPGDRWLREAPALTQADLPDMQYCPERWCGSGDIPRCANYEQPVFGQASVVASQPDDDGAWVIETLPSPERRVPEEEIDLPGCRHPNACSGWVLDSPESEGPGAMSPLLEFTLPAIRHDVVAICCGAKGCGERLASAEVELLIDGEAPRYPFTASGGGKCAVSQPPGDADFSLREPRDVKLSVRIPARDFQLPPITHVYGM